MRAKPFLRRSPPRNATFRIANLRRGAGGLATGVAGAVAVARRMLPCFGGGLFVKRFPFLDWMRGLAVVIMIQCHVFNSFARM
ncbi:MAG: hypothetical protein ABSC51_12395, partial [Gaiellaceae bacterium]